ncbi:hypothetical protein UA08_07196 [Talaromyces atroroseus]|uniref:Short-chain dehydrogenase TIC 32, chloroplastic n=1 Tax=Talaromyces atroroseus TaxID=1441469 RepID=A0A225AFD9_TALAT|nr:hypothetical protein UA08_07196 [Talaromyces atroroseus]OKL57833.1 hypothetical protein UA08_07196 [Talaromyces atroroseus]
MDNTSFASIRRAASQILEQSNNQVNILINTAGVMGIQELTLTEDHYEIHFATNYLGHFLLFQLLKPALLASVTPSFNSRVVNVSSCAQRAARLEDNDNIDLQKHGYDAMAAYANAKLASIYMSNEIDRRYRDRGLHATSLHPGGVSTNIGRHMGPRVGSRASQE